MLAVLSLISLRATQAANFELGQKLLQAGERGGNSKGALLKQEASFGCAEACSLSLLCWAGGSSARSNRYCQASQPAPNSRLI